jgi:uncharacterized coiled-coil protein SlyX
MALKARVVELELQLAEQQRINSEINELRREERQRLAELEQGIREIPY